MSNEELLTKLDKYTNIFINEKKVLNSSDNTIKTYSYILEKFYEYILEKDELSTLKDISKEIILNFLNLDAHLATNTKILYLRVLKSFFTFIDEKEGLKGYFELQLKKLSIKAEQKEVEALSSYEVDKLLELLNKKTNSFNKNRDALLIKLILFTGIRATETLDLQLDAFESIEVDEQQMYKIKIVGKGSKERFVYILKEKIQRELDFLIENNYIKNYIAITNQNKRMSRVGLYSVISNKMKKAGINKKGVHILRHTFARDLVRKNINLQTISELLGHANIMLTVKVYARSNEGSKARAVL